jgi:hypothetical protein
MSALLLVATVAAPCAAADSAAGPPAALGATASLTTLSAVSTSLLRANPPARAQAQAPSAMPTESRQFFRTKKGAAVVALLAAGFSYTLYSKFHDELKSPIREQ